jgi:hypothetical protein
MGGLEQGRRNISLRTFERLAEPVGLDPLDLLQPTDD